MSTPTATELKAFVSARIGIEDTLTDIELVEIFNYYADAINAKKKGYRYLKARVLAEQFSSTESVNIQDPQEKVTLQDNIDFSVLTIARVSAGKYKVTTGYNDANSANLRDNGRVMLQCFHDLPAYDYLKNGSSTFPADDIGLSTVIDFVSPGVFDVYISDAGVLKDTNFYLTIELFNMPNLEL